MMGTLRGFVRTHPSPLGQDRIIGLKECKKKQQKSKENQMNSFSV